jgi:hypothetical protein
MMRSALLLALAIVGGADAFKFMSNFQPAKILTNDQKVELAKTKERFGDKSKFTWTFIIPIDIFDSSFVFILTL